MKRALIITTVSGFVPQFEMNNVKILQSMSYEVHYATNYNMTVYGKDNSRLDNTGIIRHQIDFRRSPFDLINNLKAYKQLKELMKLEKFDLVHCHTPMGGMLGRIASVATKTSPVIYTAHGFHFYKGASIINWLIYFTVESIMARFTDVLITINKEDYYYAQKFKIRHSGAVEFIKGIGINTEIGYNYKVNRLEKYKEFGIDKESYVIISVGELSKRKNHKVIIKALAKLKNKRITYLICGTGVFESRLRKMVKALKLEEQVVFAGYRKDIYEILSISDCFVFPSFQEGLPVALLEAMVIGLPVICSKIRGNVDLIDDNQGGYLVDALDVNAFGQAINNLLNDNQKMKDFGIYNRQKVKEFDIKVVSKNMERIYNKFN